jgi:signal recognition particle subunit SRP54
MFDTLSSSLQKTFKNLRGYGKVSEKNIKDALREVRMSLLEADVNFQVAKDFIARVKDKCMGEDVLTSVTPGQQIIKRVHEEMVELLGSHHKDFDFGSKPSMVMLLGLHGVGKTTTGGKLARKWKAEGKKVLLVACDIRRPAAVQQLSVLAEQAEVDILIPNDGETVPALGKRAKELAIKEWYDVVLFDTGGRFAIDEELVGELEALRSVIEPRNVVLVLDAAIGQESVNVAQTFNEKVGLTGLILTKMDGDARGGAALSVQSITGCPIHLIGVGEKQENLEAFHPDRMANRILGMGDVVSLVEKVQTEVNEDEMMKMQERMFAGDFNYEDMLMQFQQVKKMGPIEGLMDMVPGMPTMSAEEKAKVGASSAVKTKLYEAIIQSMTVRERKNPNLLNASRKRRIAKGSGTEVRYVNELMKQFLQTKKMSKKLKKWQKRLLKMGR